MADRVAELEAKLAALSDWAAIAAENDAIRARAGRPVHEQLKALRAEVGLNQRDLAAAAGVHQGTVSRVEQGYPEVQLDTVVKLLDALGADLVVLPREGP